jgi:hypothetical protein
MRSRPGRFCPGVRTLVPDTRAQRRCRGRGPLLTLGRVSSGAGSGGTDGTARMAMLSRVEELRIQREAACERAERALESARARLADAQRHLHDARAAQAASAEALERTAHLFDRLDGRHNGTRAVAGEQPASQRAGDEPDGHRVNHRAGCP